MLWGTTGATVLVAVVYLEQKWESIPFQTGLGFSSRLAAQGKRTQSVLLFNP